MDGIAEQRGYPVFRLAQDPAKKISSPQSDQHSHWLETSWEHDAQQTQDILNKLENTIDWLIVDHYALNKKWETTFRPSVKHILALDDLPDRSHDCDIILNQNFYSDPDSIYEGIVPSHCQKLIGPSFSLLHSTYRELRQSLREHDGTVKRILVFFGSSDLTHETKKTF